MTKEELEKENKALGERCLQLQKDKGNLIDRVRELEQKLEQIKNEKFEKALSQIKHDREVVIEYNERLQKENTELKDCFKIAKDNEYEYQSLFTKAKEIIKKLYAVYYDPCVTESDLKYRDELFAEIKQFLSEVEK